MHANPLCSHVRLGRLTVHILVELVHRAERRGGERPHRQREAEVEKACSPPESVRSEREAWAFASCEEVATTALSSSLSWSYSSFPARPRCERARSNSLVELCSQALRERFQNCEEREVEHKAKGTGRFG